MSKCDCKKCYFGLIPKVTGGNTNCFDICTDYPVGMGANEAVMDCLFRGLWTYYLSGKIPKFKCDCFINRGIADRAYSKGKICQYMEIYSHQLYYDVGDYRKTLSMMWDSFYSVDKIKNELLLNHRKRALA